MTAAGSLFERRDAGEGIDRQLDLVSSSDDFSFKVSSPTDRRYWIRVEREVDRGTLVITDCNPGDRSTGELVAGLLIAVRVVAGRDVRALVFRDLVPSGDQAPDFPIKLVHAADLVKRLGSAVAAHLRVDVKSFDMQPRRGKIDGIIHFA